MYYEINVEDMEDMAGRHLPTAAKMEQVGAFLRSQVSDRFATSGASGGETWPPVRLPPRAGNPALIGIVSLEHTYSDRGSASSDGGEAVVASDYPWIKTHQFGATIVPVNAKALWIPISERAKLMAKFGSAPIMRIESGKFKGLELTQSSVGALKFGEDFIYLKRAVIPPRKMLPDSPNERAASIGLTLKLLAEG